MKWLMAVLVAVLVVLAIGIPAQRKLSKVLTTIQLQEGRR